MHNTFVVVHCMRTRAANGYAGTERPPLKLTCELSCTAVPLRTAQLGLKPGLKGLQFLLGNLPSWLSYTEREKIDVSEEMGAWGRGCMWVVGGAAQDRGGAAVPVAPRASLRITCTCQPSADFKLYALLFLPAVAEPGAGGGVAVLRQGRVQDGQGGWGWGWPCELVSGGEGDRVGWGRGWARWKGVEPPGEGMCNLLYLS